MNTLEVRAGTRETPAAGSYVPSTTTAGGWEAECARLEAQAELTFGEELRILREFVLPGDGPLLEVGAGPGAVTRRLRATRHDLDVWALDIDPDLLARGQAGPALVGDAARLPLASEAVGCVLLRYVLQHVIDPVAVLREARRVLRPGGHVLVTDVDAALWGVCEPAAPDAGQEHRALARAQQRAGGDRSIGRSLTRLLRAAGFDRTELRPFAVTNDTRPTTDFEVHLGPGRLAPLVASGDLSLAELAAAAGRWNRFVADPDAYVLLLGFTAIGLKTSAAQALPPAAPPQRKESR